MANVEPQAIGAAFDGSGTFEFGEPRRFEITNRSTGRGGRNLVPMTGTVHATIVGDDYRFDHNHRLPGFDFEGRMSGRINRKTALLSTMSGPGACARERRRRRAASSLATLGFPVPEIAAEVHGAVDLPMTLGGSYRLPEFETQLTGDAVDLPLIGRVRAAAHVVADTRNADITAIDIRRGTSAITGHAVADITTSTWTGGFEVDAPHAEELQADVPEAWRVAGPMHATATLGGTFDVYTLDTTITGSALTWAGQSIDKVDRQGDGDRRGDRRDGAVADAGRRVRRWPRALRVGDRRVRRAPQGRSAVVARHRAGAQRYAGDVLAAVRRRRHDREAGRPGEDRFRAHRRHRRRVHRHRRRHGRLARRSRAHRRRACRSWARP